MNKCRAWTPTRIISSDCAVEMSHDYFRMSSIFPLKCPWPQKGLTVSSYDYTGDKHEVFRSIIFWFKCPHRFFFHLLNKHVRASYVVGPAPWANVLIIVSKMDTISAFLERTSQGQERQQSHNWL